MRLVSSNSIPCDLKFNMMASHFCMTHYHAHQILSSVVSAQAMTRYWGKGRQGHFERQNSQDCIHLLCRGKKPQKQCPSQCRPYPVILAILVKRYTAANPTRVSSKACWSCGWDSVCHNCVVAHAYLQPLSSTCSRYLHHLSSRPNFSQQFQGSSFLTHCPSALRPVQ